MTLPLHPLRGWLLALAGEVVRERDAGFKPWQLRARWQQFEGSRCSRVCSAGPILPLGLHAIWHVNRGALLVLGQTRVISIGKGKLAATTEYPYVFTFTVSKGQKLSTSASMAVQVQNRKVSAVRAVSVGAVSSPRHLSDGLMVNEGEKLILSGSCEGNRPSFVWTFSPPLAQWFPMGRNSMSFVVASGASRQRGLQGGVRYSVSFECQLADGSTASAALRLEVNSPPQGGSCQSCVAGASACTKHGAPLVDTFVMESKEWADTDAQLAYEFGYQIASNAGVEGEHIWFHVSSMPLRELQLPSGNVVVLARVLDVNGASTEILSDMVVVGQSGRRQLLGGINFKNMLDQITAKLQTQDASGVNLLATTTVLQLAQTMPMPENAVLLVQVLMVHLESAKSFAVVNSEYQCECLQTAHKITLPDPMQSEACLLKATRLVYTLALQKHNRLSCHLSGPLIPKELPYRFWRQLHV